MATLLRKLTQMRSTPTTIGETFGEKGKDIIQRNAAAHQWPFATTNGIQHSQNEHSIDYPLKQQMLERSSSTFSTLEKHSEKIDIRLKKWKSDFSDYIAIYPEILTEITAITASPNGNETVAWFTKNLKYNVPSSTKQMFGLITVITYKSLIIKDQLTAENLKLAQYLGWCIELFHSFFNITDDVMDQSTTRRGQLCWYKLREASSTTPNDVVMVENGIYELLRKHFRHRDCYVDLLDLFHEMTFRITRGQLMDFLVSKKCVRTFNMETYNSIVMDKTCCHMLYLPAALALHLADIKHPHTFHQCRAILRELSHFCQVQNDFLDTFGNPDITGKIGTDIQANKCSWLAIVCMQRANPEQKAIMVECYGKNDPYKIARVKQLYEYLNIPGIYAKYEEETYNELRLLIQQSSNDIPQEVFLNILELCYQR